MKTLIMVTPYKASPKILNAANYTKTQQKRICSETQYFSTPKLGGLS